MTFYLGVDAGGTTSRSRLTDARGVVIGTGMAGPANAGLGIDTMHQALQAVAGQAIAEAGLDEAAIAQIRAGYGVAGTSRPGFREALQGLTFPFPVRFETDACVANLGAHAGADGAILILGTGSIAQVRVRGRDFTIGGYGFPISDEGSGAAIGLSAVRHSLRALDGRIGKTPLSKAISATFEDDTSLAIAWMDGAQPGDYARFAPIVMEYANRDDPIARNIVEDAADHIECFIDTIFARGATSCALMGGLAPHMRPWLRARTTARLREPLGDALDGALRLAGLDRAIAS